MKNQHLFISLIALSIFSTTLFISCNKSQESYNTSSKNDEELTNVVWPPDTLNNIFKNIPADLVVKYDWSFNQSGMHGMDAHGRFDNPFSEKEIKEKGFPPDAAFKIAGEFNSTLGTVKAKAKVKGWKKFMDTDGETMFCWGPIIESGEIIVDKNKLAETTTKVEFQNSYSIESVGSRYVLIKIDETKRDQLILIQSFNENGISLFSPTPNTVTTSARLLSNNMDVHTDGWYNKGKLILNVKSK
jgi:hypothetical protein